MGSAVGWYSGCDKPPMFSTQDSALAFERYLKSGSGRAFAKRHFV